MRVLLSLLVLAGVALCGAYYTGLLTPAPEVVAPAAPVPVTVAVVVQQAFADELTTFGRMTPLDTVNLQARVTARLAEALARDGQRVEEGQLLFRFDDREFALAVRRAEAALAVAEAQAGYDKLEFDRYEELFRADAATREQRDSREATHRISDANREAAAAALDEARLQREYCEIRAPFAGALGKILVTAGNLATENVSELAVLHRLAPLRVSFFAPETRLADVRAALTRADAVVAVAPDDGGGRTHEGRLVFLDNAVDAAAGVIRLEGEIDNPDLALWPGQYVRVRLRLKTDADALVMPEAALQAGPGGVVTAAVVRDDNTVEFRELTLVRQAGGQAMVTGDLKPGDRVVVDGFLRLTPGAAVDVKP